MKFEYWHTTKGLWYFHLKARNGQIVASSEGYTTEQSCLKGIRAVKKCLFAKVVEI